MSDAPKTETKKQPDRGERIPVSILRLSLFPLGIDIPGMHGVTVIKTGDKQGKQYQVDHYPRMRMYCITYLPREGDPQPIYIPEHWASYEPL